MRGSKYKDSQSDLKSIEKLNRVMQAPLQNLRTKEIERWKSNSVLYLPREGLAGEVSKGLFEKTKKICETNDDPTAEINCAFITGLFVVVLRFGDIMMRVYKMTDPSFVRVNVWKRAEHQTWFSFSTKPNIFVTFTVSKSEWTTIIDILPFYKFSSVFCNDVDIFQVDSTFIGTFSKSIYIYIYTYISTNKGIFFYYMWNLLIMIR